jgi:hypothetical protein
MVLAIGAAGFSRLWAMCLSTDAVVTDSGQLDPVVLDAGEIGRAKMNVFIMRAPINI